MRRPKIVILGAGYGGLMTTVNLQKALGQNAATITLVHKNDYHYQATWLHESAAGTMKDDRTRVTIKDIVNMNRVNFVQETVISIEPKEKKVKLENDELDYDILVVALGFEVETFGIPGIQEHAFTFADINSARLIREHIKYNFARYNYEKEKDQSRLNIVVGGAGVSGMEFIGELANRIPELCKEYDVDQERVRILAIEDESTIMPEFDRQLIDYASNSLQARGVEFITDATVKECKSDCVVYEKNGERVEIPTMTTVWTAGFKVNSIIEKSGFNIKHGKVEVNEDLRVSDDDHVFVLGDCRFIKKIENDRPYPSTLQFVVQAADLVAHNIEQLINGDQLEVFEPTNLGMVASLGNNDAIGMVFNKRKIYGWKATVMKKLIDNRYLYKLGGLSLLIDKGKFNFFY